MTLITASAAIIETKLDFGDSAEYARKRWPQIAGFSKVEASWEGTVLHFLSESIQPNIKSIDRPRVMLLFSNPHPDSVKTGLFMSEKISRKFWDILFNIEQLNINHTFDWESGENIHNTVSLLLNGDYGGPLLFFECLYQIPSRSPKDLRKLFQPGSGDFEKYLHRPSIERISSILENKQINVVLVFTGETFEYVICKPGISKDSREKIHSAVRKALDKGNEGAFWDYMDKFNLRDQARLSNSKHKCTAIKLIDTRAKNWWSFYGRSTFSYVLDYALKFAGQVS